MAIKRGGIVFDCKLHEILFFCDGKSFYPVWVTEVAYSYVLCKDEYGREIEMRCNNAEHFYRKISDIPYDILRKVRV